MRRIIARLLLLVFCATSVCACRSEPFVVTPPQPRGSAELQTLQELQMPYVGMVLKSLHGEFYPLIKAGAEAEADRLGVELIVVAPDDESDAEGQAELVNIMADMALDVLLIAPCDEKTLTDSLQKATANGKHILSIDEKLMYSGSEGYIGADDYNGGFREGAYAATIAAAPSAVILRGAGGSRNHGERTMGLRTSLTRSGITDITCAVCNVSRTEAYQQTQTLLAQGAAIGVICTTDDDMAIGAQQAVEESGRAIPIVSFDGTPAVLQMVQAGELDGAIMQDAYEIGVRSIQAAVQASDNRMVGNVYAPLKLVTPPTAQDDLDRIEQRLRDDDMYY